MPIRRSVLIVGLFAALFGNATGVTGQEMRVHYEEAARVWRAAAAASKDPKFQACAIRQAQFYECTAQSLGNGTLSCQRPSDCGSASVSGSGAGSAAPSLPSPTSAGAAAVTAAGDALASLIGWMDRRERERFAEAEARDAERARLAEERSAETRARTAEIKADIDQLIAESRERARLQPLWDRAHADYLKRMHEGGGYQAAFGNFTLGGELSESPDPPEEPTPERYWHFWQYFQTIDGGQDRSTEFVTWIGDTGPSGTLRDAPFGWAIRTKHPGKLKIVYEVALECIETCRTNWHRYEAIIDGGGVVYRSPTIRAFAAQTARLISLTPEP
jgi:hypothetical protein